MAYRDHFSHSMLYTEQGEQLMNHQSQLFGSSEVSASGGDALKLLPPGVVDRVPAWMLRSSSPLHDSAAHGIFRHLQPAGAASGTTAGASSSSTPHEAVMPPCTTEVASRGAAAERGSSWKCKADIMRHPLYEQLLKAHVECLLVLAPEDQLPRIHAQAAKSGCIVAKYKAAAAGGANSGQDEDLDRFMAQFVTLLSSFKEQLQQHFQVHVLEALKARLKIEQHLYNLTGASTHVETDETMSDEEEEEDQTDSDTNLFDTTQNGDDSMGFGLPTESERCLLEHVRQELKHELKQGFKEKILDIREEIHRKRRAGKLPGDSIGVLKAWWNSHSDWPYPSVEEKASLMQETRLELKQINNWFINQRKRTNWNNKLSMLQMAKNKAKSGREVM